MTPSAAQADEYDEAFLGVTPVVGIINNVEWEHVDKYPTEQDVLRAFEARLAFSGLYRIELPSQSLLRRPLFSA